MEVRMIFFAVIIAIASSASVAAQTSFDTAQGPPPDAALMPAPLPKAGIVSMHIDNMDAAPVKGAPFCATIATEHTQVFADGNRIHTADNSTLCRDSQGRTRREAALELMGATAQKPDMKLITIIDPVAGFRYVLDPYSKVGRRMPFSGRLAKEANAVVAGKGERMMVYRNAGGGEGNVAFSSVFVKRGGPSDEPAPATENLGDQTIEGIHATGTRITTTIPAGKMGNEQPIIVTSERWYSPELKATVLTKHNDPWAGELKTQFTGVNTSEPDASLFLVPSDYKIVDEKAGPFQIQLPSPAPQ